MIRNNISHNIIFDTHNIYTCVDYWLSHIVLLNFALIIYIFFLNFPRFLCFSREFLLLSCLSTRVRVPRYLINYFVSKISNTFLTIRPANPIADDIWRSTSVSTLSNYIMALWSLFFTNTYYLKFVFIFSFWQVQSLAVALCLRFVLTYIAKIIKTCTLSLRLPLKIYCM